MIKKQTAIDRIEILENGTIQVREANRIFEDDKLLAETYHRYVLAPGVDVSGKTDKIQALCNLIWTDEIKENYADMISKQKIVTMSKS